MCRTSAHRVPPQMEYGSKGAKEMEAKMAAMKREALAKAERAKRVDVKEDLIDQVGGWKHTEWDAGNAMPAPKCVIRCGFPSATRVNTRWAVLARGRQHTCGAMGG